MDGSNGKTYGYNMAGVDPATNGTNGRCTFMGNLNPFPGFQAPATGC